MVKRILGILLMLVGAFGVLTCVLAGLHTWRMAEDVAAMADDTLGLLLDTLDGVERSLGVVSATLDNAAMGIGSLHTTTLGVGETLSTARSTLGGIAHLAEGDLSQSLEFSIVTLKTLEQTAGMADDVLRGLSLLGVGGYDPSTVRRKFLTSLGGQRLANECPFEGFGHRLIEVVNKVQKPLM